MLKSIAVVVGCYLLSIVLVLATDPILALLFHGQFAKGHLPSNLALLTSTALFVALSIFCAWLCARFALRLPGSPPSAARHVLWFFILGEVMGVIATIPNWNRDWPRWYWVSWLLTWPVSCWIGLLLAKRRAAQPSI